MKNDLASFFLNKQMDAECEEGLVSCSRSENISKISLRGFLMPEARSGMQHFKKSKWQICSKQVARVVKQSQFVEGKI